jgi:hypothetical protein
MSDAINVNLNVVNDNVNELINELSILRNVLDDIKQTLCGDHSVVLRNNNHRDTPSTNDKVAVDPGIVNRIYDGIRVCHVVVNDIACIKDQIKDIVG